MEFIERASDNDLFTATTADTSSSHRASRKPSSVLLGPSVGMCEAHHSSIYSTLTVIPPLETSLLM